MLFEPARRAAPRARARRRRLPLRSRRRRRARSPARGSRLARSLSTACARCRSAAATSPAASSASPRHRSRIAAITGSAGRRAGGGTRLVQPPGVRVEVCPPRADPLRLDALLVERIAHAVRQRCGVVPVAGPRLDDDLVEQDVPERRLVALVARLLLGLAEPRARAVEVVDVAEPLPELEDDAAVDRRRQRRRRSLAAPRRAPLPPRRSPGRGRARRAPVLPSAAAASAGSSASSPSSSSTPSRRRGRLREVDRARIHRDLRRGSVPAGSHRRQSRAHLRPVRRPPIRPCASSRFRRASSAPASAGRPGRALRAAPRAAPAPVRSRSRDRDARRDRAAAAASPRRRVATAATRARADSPRCPAPRARGHGEQPTSSSPTTARSGPSQPSARWYARSTGSVTTAARSRCIARRRDVAAAE